VGSTERTVWTGVESEDNSGVTGCKKNASWRVTGPNRVEGIFRPSPLNIGAMHVRISTS
jgi:hypothetical protein